MTSTMTTMKSQRTLERLRRIGRGLVRHLPEHAYPSDHPWQRHHDPERPRG